MYEWLDNEVEAVKWRKFFVFERNVKPQAINEVEKQFASLPKDFKAYLFERGESKLFRSLNRDSYNMAVFAKPQTLEGLNGKTLLVIGYFIDAGYAYFRNLSGSANVEPGVFEGSGLQVRKSADSFEEWFKKRFESARRLYKKSEWKRILRGAIPFSEQELRIVDAIKKYDFEKVGISPDGKVFIKVHNGSEMQLRYLSIGARANGRLEGGIRLHVSGIEPGETKIIEQAG